MTRNRRPLLLATVLASTACGSPSGSGGDDGFVSDNPGGGGGGGDYGGDDDAAGEDGGEGGGGPSDDGGEDGDGGGEDAIEEADLIRIVGNRLYALSQISGLTIVDVSERDRLPVLGHYRAHGRPFEMYVDGDQVFIMYSDFGEYSYVEDEGYAWRQNSRLLALDTSEPDAIELRGEFDMPGSIQDSRRVGDFLYLVTYENGYCWGCKNTANTTITSLDVSNPADVAIADQISFEDSDNGYYWYGGQRSVSSTTERMYVAGPEFGADGNHSIIQVVDISDENGALVEGAAITVHGQIESRWQMDEYEGVLRVISQPWWGNEDETPVLETFQITSSQDIVPLASLSVVLPRPEVLQSARFDGDRAYAITFEQTDPLFTFDLSDPANPQQMGELEIPGWVHHMEPRGDRLLGLGFDQEHPDGAINVSLFDVSDLSQPQLLDRVHFGGDWANFTEDQNRLHKAFSVLDEEGLLLVPFQGWSWEDSYDYCSAYRSGIQLIDFSTDDLVLRGLAESHGTARRSFLHDERLFAVSDKSIQTFDISNRDAPVQKLGLAVAANVNRSVRAGDVVVRLASDWWTSETRVEVVDADQADEPMPLGVLPLADILSDGSSVDGEGGCYWLYDTELVANGDYVYLIYTAWGEQKGTTKIMVIDVANPAQPTYVDTVTMDFVSESWWSSFGGFQLPTQRVVLRGSTMVFTSNDVEYDEYTPSSKGQFVLVDVSDPEAPEQLIELDRPDALQHGGLLPFGDTAVSWHARAVGDDDSRVRFYLERIELGGERAVQRKPVNVPGLPVAYDPDSERAITVDFEVEVLENVDEWEECFQQIKAWDLQEDGCRLVRQYVNIVQLNDSSADRLARQELEPERRIQSVVGSTRRAFVVSSDRSEYYWGWGAEDTPDSDGEDDYQPPIYGVSVVAGMGEGDVKTGGIVELGADYWGWGGNSRTSGNQLLLPSRAGLAIIDGEDEAAPSMRVEVLYGYSCQHIEVSDDTAYCSMGENGLQTISLD